MGKDKASNQSISEIKQKKLGCISLANHGTSLIKNINIFIPIEDDVIRPMLTNWTSYLNTLAESNDHTWNMEIKLHDLEIEEEEEEDKDKKILAFLSDTLPGIKIKFANKKVLLAKYKDLKSLITLLKAQPVLLKNDKLECLQKLIENTEKNNPTINFNSDYPIDEQLLAAFFSPHYSGRMTIDSHNHKESIKIYFSPIPPKSGEKFDDEIVDSNDFNQLINLVRGISDYEFIHKLHFNHDTTGYMNYVKLTSTHSNPAVELLLSQKMNDKLAICYINSIVNYGCFARRTIQKDEEVCCYLGRVLDKQEYNRSSYRFNLSSFTSSKKKDLLSYSNFFFSINGLKVGTVIDGKHCGNETTFINHAPSLHEQSDILTANLEAVKYTHHGIAYIVLRAKRDIQVGEQLLFDYGDNYSERLCLFKQDGSIVDEETLAPIETSNKFSNNFAEHLESVSAAQSNQTPVKKPA